jgi:hypothetical protein
MNAVAVLFLALRVVFFRHVIGARKYNYLGDRVTKNCNIITVPYSRIIFLEAGLGKYANAI